MAFDNETRGKLQRFVTDIRALLTDDFTRQLQQTYGMDPVSGEVASIEGLKHLDDERLGTAQILRDIMDHYLASETKNEKQTRISVLRRIAREQAFTVLNRLAALRMMEARGILLESVAQGTQSQAFRLYQQVANGSLGGTGETYKHFLNSLFDLFASDLPSLFDRYGPQSRLFPREVTLTKALDLINGSEIEPLWAEDETIGWIYQYFNSREERKAMRDASQAPRNSRELAVRNQFFTPRYVVEFLVDNTLGRLWFNWTGGQTELRDHCQYLLVKPDEQPEPAKRLRDPRTIKLLDPACGSMHFGLYAFDLFLEIYREAWAWEQTQGPGCLDTESGGSADLKPLSQTYADQDAFLHDVPRLIIEHNIYGVDIDPRAAQIASLALWLRAQRAWHEADVKAKDRPQVGRGHVVAAVAPPAEVDLRKRFMEELDAKDAELFEKTLFLLKDLPELGVLLQVEKELPALVREAFGELGDLFRKEDMAQWQKAEERLHSALTEFARAARSTYQGRLFAQDALQGLRMIDLCREKFDAVVMNPPFGVSSRPIFELQKKLMPDCAVELYAQFLNRAMSLLQGDGIVGAISSRSFLTISRLKAFRSRRIVPHIELVADLGAGVMDDAFVEAAAYTLSNSPSDNIIGFDLRDSEDPASDLKEITKDHHHSNLRFEVYRKEISELPNQKILYNVPSPIRSLLSIPEKFEPDVGTVRQGMGTFDDFRFLRLRWEILPDRIFLNKWEPLAKGGAFYYYYSDIYLLLNWIDDGAELSAVNIAKNGQDAQVRQASDYWRTSGLTYSKRSQKGFSARVLPSGCIIAGKGPAIISLSDVSPTYILGWINSRLIKWMIEIQANDHEYNTGILKGLPWKNPEGQLLAESKELEMRTSKCLEQLMRHASSDEVNSNFLMPRSAAQLTEGEDFGKEIATNDLASIMEAWDNLIDRVYSVDSTGLMLDEEEEGDSKIDDDYDDAEVSEAEEDPNTLISWATGTSFGRFDFDLATGVRKIDRGIDPFSALPAKSPGMLPDGAEPFHVHSGILVDDQGHRHDLPHLIEEVLTRVGASVPADVRRWLQRDFFKFHLKQYSKSRRKAPIYWPISTSSGSYTLWFYYPSLNDQTLFTAINDFVEPKLKQVGEDAIALRNKGSARSSADEESLEKLESLETELTELRETLLEIAPTYRPNHDDGVQITAAPLWRLFRHRPWQNALKATWEKLEKGDYDWAHLAMSYWPDRVREKCKTDKSLAIAHDLEALYEEPETGGAS